MGQVVKKNRLLLVSEAQLARIKQLGIKAVIVSPPRTAERHKPPTRRQTEILNKIASGYSTQEIAWALKLSAKTIETHRALLMERIGIRHIPGLVRYALQTGVLPASWLVE